MEFSKILNYYLLTLAALFPMVNPFSTIPLLLSLAGHQSEGVRQRMALKASINAGIIMIVALFLGSAIMAFFNISLPALRVAGGLIVATLGFRMLFPGNTSESDNMAESSENYALIPLALPSMAGAGTLATIMTFSSQINEQHTLFRVLGGYGIVVAAVLTVVVLCAIILRASTRIVRYLGKSGLDAMARIMGLLMICIGVQFMADGVTGFVHAASSA